MDNDRRDEEAEVEVVCPRCGYRSARTVGRLRRDIPVICPNCGYRITDDGRPDTRWMGAQRNSP